MQIYWPILTFSKLSAKQTKQTYSMTRKTSGWADRREQRNGGGGGGSLVYAYLACFNVVMGAGWCLVAAQLVRLALVTGSLWSALELAFAHVGTLVRTFPTPPPTPQISLPSSFPFSQN
jgi:hypothetical protein